MDYDAIVGRLGLCRRGYLVIVCLRYLVDWVGLRFVELGPFGAEPRAFCDFSCGTDSLRIWAEMQWVLWGCIR